MSANPIPPEQLALLQPALERLLEALRKRTGKIPATCEPAVTYQVETEASE